MICDVTGVAQYFLKNPRGGHVFCTVLDFELFAGRFIFESVGNKSAKD